MDYPVLINGKNYDWGSVSFIIFNVPIVGITEIEYSRKQKKELNYGAGTEPTGYGLGNKEYSGSISIYADVLKDFISTVPDRSILSIPPSSATVIFSGDGVQFTTDKLKNIMFTEDPFSVKQNDTAIIIKLPFIFAGLNK
jgi:hypothetical protein